MTDLSARTLRVEELGSGTVYGYVLPNSSQLMLKAGFFPAAVSPVMKRFLNAPIDFLQKEESLSEDEQRQYEEGKARLVAWMVRTVDGEEATLEWEQVADPERFPADDFDSLVVRAIRLKPAPKATKVDPTPEVPAA